MTQQTSVEQRILDRLESPDVQEQLRGGVVAFTDVYGLFTGERNGLEVYEAIQHLKQDGKIEFVTAELGWRPGYRALP